MKDTDGQLYTIEGISAGLIMIMTAYLVVNATSVYTAGDTHISDMQLEVPWKRCIENDGYSHELIHEFDRYQSAQDNHSKKRFRNLQNMFLNLTNNSTGLSPDYLNKIGSTMDYVQFSASYTCRDRNNVTKMSPQLFP